MTGPAIELRSARREYDDGQRRTVAAVDGVELAVPAGRFVSVIGPSGCGKSTLLRLVAGLETPDAGEVLVCGTTPEAAAADKLIGFVPQTPALLPWLSVRRNVLLPLRVNKSPRRARGTNGTDGERVDALLERAGLAEVASALPHQLSGGMQQRAAIVRALALHPDVLLMDEPFSALDEFTRASLQEQLLGLWSDLGATVLFVTHSIAEAVRLSDQVVVMGHGRILRAIPVDLPRPRQQDDLEDPAFRACEIEVRDALREAFEVTR